MFKLLPSAQWFSVARRLWELMTLRERWLSGACLVTPVLNRICFLGSFGLSLKAITSAAKGKIPEHQHLLVALGILGVFTVAGIIRWAGSRIESSFRKASVAMIRRVVAGHLVRGRELGREEAKTVLADFRKVESRFVKTCSRILVDFMDLLAALFLIGVLTSLITWVLPVVGLLMVVGGLVTFSFFRFRIRRRKEISQESSAEAKKQLKKTVRALVIGKKPERAVIARYENNRLDRLNHQRVNQSQKFRVKLSWIVTAAGGALMVFAFYFAAAGKFEGYDPILLILFAFALRFSIRRAQLALQKWSALLREREAIGILRQMLQGQPGWLGSGDMVFLTVQPEDQEEDPHEVTAIG